MALPAPSNNANVAAKPAEAADLPVEGAIEAVQRKTQTQASPAGSSTAATPAAAAAAAAPPAPDRIKLLKAENGQFRFPRGTRLINNISWVVGLLELANAGDFAANVWNVVPVPVYAIVFMAIGGTVAGVLSVFAFLDSRLSCQNVRFLRLQRRKQKAERARRLEHSEAMRDVDVRLAVTFRELGSEVINRWVMDLLMGCGAVLISVGTFMAIGGANEDVWFASNILSGYLGNTPIALFGLVNCMWAAFIWTKAQGHVIATRKALRGSLAAALVKRRSRNVQAFAITNGTATILGGVGSLLTATRWWAYVILIPVIISSIFCNLWWRRRVGYTRAPLRDGVFPPIVPSELVADLEFAAHAEIAIREQQTAPINQFVADPTSLPDVLGFLEQHAMLDIFCLKVVSVPELCDALNGKDSTELDIGVDNLLAVPEPLHPRLLELAQECVRDMGPEHFRNRERYMAEMLGTYYNIAGNVDFDGNEEMPETKSTDSGI
ncbi:hypothetical protein TOPH_06357 [Tolypocladium ophioglossoides CBS 100239]|uniref:Integral membrane protein n=1 Tax=Tolypocladium ophioglossoides (strain CBS 100239) TaxID=1163406 RepID=A0A0L0N5G5_TOLOC|nr:hypothetical protein TOPH_06357 [Tolypocladium ophioglossoides CBS 100239]